MEYITHPGSNRAVVEVRATDVIIRDADDALDVLATARYHGRTEAVVLHAATIDSRFFDLSSGLAGAVLQKVSNYGLALGIVGDFSDVTSRALRDFIRESNDYGQVVFVPDVDTAIARLGDGSR